MEKTTIKLNEIMEFDHVIIVHENGTVTDAPTNDRRYWAPDLHEGEISSVIIDGNVVDAWEFFPNKRNGIREDCEFIGGQLEQDILETPGVYVALANYSASDHCPTCYGVVVENNKGSWVHESPFDPDPFAYDSDTDPCDMSDILEPLWNTTPEGWTIVRLKDNYAPS